MTRSNKTLVACGLVLGAVLGGCRPADGPADGPAASSTGSVPADPPAPSGDSGQPPASQPPSAESLGLQLKDAGAVAEAGRLLDRMAEAYQKAPAFTDHIEVRMFGGPAPGPSSTQECTVLFGPGTDAYVRIPVNEFVSIGDSVYLTDTRVKDKFVRVAREKNLLATCRKEFGAYEGLGRLLCALRFGEPREEIMAALAFGLPGETRLASYGRVTDERGREVEQLGLVVGANNVFVQVDPETSFVLMAQAEVGSAADPGTRMAMRQTYRPQAHDALPEPIPFDTTQGLPFLKLSDLYRPLPGQFAPEFELPTLDGTMVALDELKGSVVVLDFWATWCAPCKRTLPLLQKFADWAAAEELPVYVFPVNVQEREQSRQQRWAKANAYWTNQQFTMPSLIDVDGEVPRLYGLQSIPATYVIDREGKVYTFHNGFDPNFDESLQREVMMLLEQ